MPLLKPTHVFTATYRGGGIVKLFYSSEIQIFNSESVMKIMMMFKEREKVGREEEGGEKVGRTTKL